MRWRGPNSTFSHLWEDRLFLGQTILSITGELPATVGVHHRSRSGRYQVLYNGEIYNFRDLEERFFCSHPELVSQNGTDTEVLTNLHEVLSPAEIPPLLDGMYAYGVFDALARQLHLVRDVQGEKSLYIYEDAQWIVIASEIRAIRMVVPGITVDPQALRDYFHTRHLMLFGRTVYQGIRQLRPGCLETLHLDSFEWSETPIVRLRDWINPKRLLENSRRSLDSLADELESLLSQCVQEMIPRGPRHAVVVSGGIDSSLIARYVLTHGNPHALVAVNHVGKDRISADLSGFEQVLGRPINIVRVDSGVYASEIPRCQQVCGGPLHSHSFVGQALQSALVHTLGCRVLFGGDGGDELFGGYEAYAGTCDSNVRFSPSPYTAYQTPCVEFEEDVDERLQEALARAWSDALDVYRFVESPRERMMLAMMYCDAAYQLSDVGLRGTDLMSMMWSVEARSVYLRRPILQFALNLPARMKTDYDLNTPSLLRAKPLLKHLFLRSYPRSLLVEKQGFAGFPNESASYLGELSDYLTWAFLGIRPSSIQKAWADRATAWKLINVEYFLRSRGLVHMDVHDAVEIR